MLRPHLRRIRFDRVANADHRSELCPLHLDRLNRVARGVDALGNDKGYGVADMAHFVFGKDRIGRTGERIFFEIEQARQIAELADVLGRQDQRDAGQCLGARGIDGEFGMGMRRAQHQRMQSLRGREVVGVAALAANERVVLFAKHALTDAELDGSSHSISVSRAVWDNHTGAD